jgi:hypothetical protein
MAYFGSSPSPRAFTYLQGQDAEEQVAICGGLGHGDGSLMMCSYHRLMVVALDGFPACRWRQIRMGRYIAGLFHGHCAIGGAASVQKETIVLTRSKVEQIIDAHARDSVTS